MSTPQLTFSEPDPSKKEDDSSWPDPLLRDRPYNRECLTSTYCGGCICGRHFEIKSLEWVCPSCHRHVVIEWTA
jgi:hypothetical protein